MSKGTRDCHRLDPDDVIRKMIRDIDTHNVEEKTSFPKICINLIDSINQNRDETFDETGGTHIQPKFKLKEARNYLESKLQMMLP